VRVDVDHGVAKRPRFAAIHGCGSLLGWI
jgi:hypothetical protein